MVVLWDTRGIDVDRQMIRLPMLASRRMSQRWLKEAMGHGWILFGGLYIAVSGSPEDLQGWLIAPSSQHSPPQAVPPPLLTRCVVLYGWYPRSKIRND